MIPKTSKQRSKHIEVYFTIIELLKRDKSLKEVGVELNLSKQAMNRYIKELKQSDVIRKIGYGTWEVNEKEVNNHLELTPTTSAQKKSVFATYTACRGHNFIFKVLLPKCLLLWEKRVEFLRLKGIDYELVKNGQIPAIKFNGLRVWLCSESIIIFYPKEKSILGKTSTECFIEANRQIVATLGQLSKLMGINLRVGGKYRYKLTKNHYGLVHHAFAKGYVDRKMRLEVRDEAGILWLLVDDSFPNLEELETVDSRSKGQLNHAVDDNILVQNWFNSMKRAGPDFTPEFIMNSLGSLTQNFEYHSENLRKHVGAIEKLGNEVTALGSGVNELVKVVKDLKGITKRDKIVNPLYK